MADTTDQMAKLREIAAQAQGWSSETQAGDDLAMAPDPNRPDRRTQDVATETTAFPEFVSAPRSHANGPDVLAPDAAQAESLEQHRQKLINDLKVMKRTRFNAQARLEDKHHISVAAFTLAAIFEIGLALIGSNFRSVLSPNLANFIEFSSQFTAVFILGFGLVATLNSYQVQAVHLQRCAMDWGNLSRELQMAGPVSREVLQDFRRRYHEIEGRCPYNHADQDYRRATRDHSDPAAVRAGRLDYFFDVYFIYALAAICYVSFFALGLWQALG